MVELELSQSRSIRSAATEVVAAGSFFMLSFVLYVVTITLRFVMETKVIDFEFGDLNFTIECSVVRFNGKVISFFMEYFQPANTDVKIPPSFFDSRIYKCAYSEIALRLSHEQI